MTEIAVEPALHDQPNAWPSVESDHFDQYQDVYRDIFLMLGAEKEDTGTLDRAVEVSQDWIRGDYGHDDGLPVALDKSERLSLREMCVDGLGMGSARELPPDDYDKLLIFGASQFGNVRRSEAMADLLSSPGHTFGKVVLLGGERPLYPKEVPGFRHLLDDEAVTAEAENDEWLAGLRADFQRMLPANADTSKVDTSVYKQFGETAQMRVSMVKALGSVALVSDRIEINASTGQPVGIQEFELAKFGMQATLLHCPPFERKNGPSRHTTESCIGDEVNVLDGTYDEKVAFIGAQPHLTRMQMTVSRAFAVAGRPDASVWATGPALDENTPVEIIASEVYKTLYEAWLLQQQQASRA